ncbi:ttuB [Scenedesmus sp. PABB004]|nr:ttuB [Scenedesmus sp. PABB004]
MADSKAAMPDRQASLRSASFAHMPRGMSAAAFGHLKTAEKKLLARVLSLNIALMLVNYLDRTNLSFASVQLNRDIGLSKSDYGLGAGLFFAAYASMQVPANMVMTKIGGPIWLGTIALLWGVVATCFAAIRNVHTFLALRFLLGLFEAGALPGMWAYLSHFYSKPRLTLPLGYLMGALIVSQAIGAPLAAGLMALDGRGGLQGWQWLFVVEGVMAVIVAVCILAFLPRDIDAVKGLTPDERAALHEAMSASPKPVGSARAALRGAVTNPAVFVGGAIKFFRDVAFYGITYWMPLVIETMLPNTDPHTRGLYSILLTAVPFVSSAVVQFFTSWHSQRANERRLHLAASWALGVACLALLPVAQMRGSSGGAFALLVIGVVGVFGVEGISVAFYLALMGGEKGAGISIINAIGALGGFVGPYVIGALTQASGNYYGAMWMLAAFLAVAVAGTGAPPAPPARPPARAARRRAPPAAPPTRPPPPPPRRAVIVRESWAAKFSLRPGQKPHPERVASGRIPSVFADGCMAAAMVGYLPEEEEEDEDEEQGPPRGAEAGGAGVELAAGAKEPAAKP